MKTILIVCVFVIGANALSNEQYEAIMAKIQVVGITCISKEHATADDMAELLNYHVPPSTHEGKCILACFYEHFNMMRADGSFDKQATIDAFNELKTMDAALYGKVLQIIDTCFDKKTIVDDRCETASLMATCVKAEADSLGITKEAFLVSE